MQSGKFLFGLVILLSIQAYPLFSQESQNFVGEDLFEACLIDLPLTYKTTDKSNYEAAARKLKETELVLVQFNRKKQTATYKHYYVVVKELKGETYVYLETPSDHISDHPQKTSYFIKYNPNENAFYEADCFEGIMANNTELESAIELLPDR